MAARSNLYHIVRMLHDPESRFMDRLIGALEEGRLCVVDVSRFSSEAALAFSGIVLDHIFEEAQERFIKPGAGPMPTIAVIEEAQSVLAGTGGGYAPFVRWVKEGRKYDLGAVMITQQPGSISDELLSQGDNWFVFHLLSSHDLKALQRANAHFSDDLLSSLLNEPIPGQCIIWAGAGGRPYPVSFMVRSFELENPPFQRTERPATYADNLKAQFPDRLPGLEGNWWDAAIETIVRSLAGDPRFLSALKTGRIRWNQMFSIVEEHMQRSRIGKAVPYEVVRAVLNRCLGEKRWQSVPDRKCIKFDQEAVDRFLDEVASLSRDSSRNSQAAGKPSAPRPEPEDFME
jgi:hypothetical protein